MTLTEFLLARIDEDEAAARAAASAERPRGGWGFEAGPAGERWETRPDAGIRRGSGMLYVPTIENAADAGLWDDEGGCDYMAPALAVGEHIARHDPARVLAECEAKRRIVEEHADRGESQGYLDGEVGRYGDMPHACGACGEFGEYGVAWPCQTLRLLALSYVHHPEFREEWRA